ncbi:MAG TPA: hypothetical protein PLD47_11915 [Aggregatilineales bacterium]|nr:hypothetical protein [Anaerolineales bacterium]HRE48421.1 hypothetical protein [Aggregatilineales bacterium]
MRNFNTRQAGILSILLGALTLFRVVTIPTEANQSMGDFSLIAAILPFYSWFPLVAYVTCGAAIVGGVLMLIGQKIGLLLAGGGFIIFFGVAVYGILTENLSRGLVNILLTVAMLLVGLACLQQFFKKA